MTDHTVPSSPGDEIPRSVKPCAWWIPTFAEPLVGRGDKRPMLYPDAKPLYDQAALDAAVAAERERFNALLDDYRGVLETLEEMQAPAAAQVTDAMVRAANAAMFGRLVQGEARFETLRIGLEAAMSTAGQRCKTCKHWSAPDGADDGYAFGLCEPEDPDTGEPMQRGFEVRLCKHPEMTRFEAPLSRDGFGLTDASRYYACLATAEDFGCVRHEERP